MGDTKIEWTRNADGIAGKTWTPIRARNKATGKPGWFCEHVSEGCRNCYAEKMNRNTYFGNGLDYKPGVLDHVELFLDEKILQQPLRWREPRNVFPCSMTDLFGRWVKDEWLDRIFAVMALASRHTFQCLTKRPERMTAYFSSGWHRRVAAILTSQRDKIAKDYDTQFAQGRAFGSLTCGPHESRFLPNVWLGVSCEDQKTADERIPLLLETPAAVRWISAEPLLGPVDLRNLRGGTFNALDGIDFDSIGDIRDAGVLGKGQPEHGLDWVVVGGESGQNARPMHPDWARSLRDQCKAAGVPFFFKQWGEWSPFATEAHYAADSLFPGNAEVWGGNCGGPSSYGAPWKRPSGGRELSTTEVGGKRRFVEVLDMPDHTWGKGDRLQMTYLRVGKKAAGRLLDGREWNEFPKVKAVGA